MDLDAEGWGHSQKVVPGCVGCPLGSLDLAGREWWRGEPGSLVLAPSPEKGDAELRR